MDRAKGLDWRLLSVWVILLVFVVSSLLVAPVPVARAGNDGAQAPGVAWKNDVAAVRQQQRTTLYSFPMDTDPGWLTEGDWAWGQPTGRGGRTGNPDPTLGHTGVNVYGYDLNGDYPNGLDSPYYLQTTALDCSGYSYVSLGFWRWLNVGQSGVDHASIEVSADGITWTTIWENPDEITDSDWTYVSYDISSIAGGSSTVYIRWGMGPTNQWDRYSGWNIDDVEILGSNAPFPACDYGPYPVPGRVEAEDYTCGGEGTAYHDLTSGHSTTLYRTDNDNVDIIVFADNSYYYLAYLATGEWLEYDVAVNETAAYDIAFRVASAVDSGRIHLEVDGTDVTGSIDVPNTGGDVNWTTVTVRDVNLAAGDHTLRFVVESQWLTFDYVEFTTVAATPTPTSTPPPADYCNDLSLGEVTFADIAGGEGGLVVLRVNNNAGVPIDISSVVVDWQYLDDLDETLDRGMNLWGVYTAPSGADLGYAEERCISCGNVENSYGSPSTADDTPRTLPAGGGYIVLDYDTDPYDPALRRLDEPPFDLVAGDFGFTVGVVGCPQPLTRARVPRGTPTPLPTSTPTPTPTPEPSGRLGKYDDFELCPLEAYQYDVRPKPPGLRECGNVLINSDFEQSGTSLAPWVSGAESQAVVASARYSCDRNGQASGFNRGRYSMLFRCDRTHGWPYEPYHPWAYQDFTVPGFVSAMDQMDLEMNVSLYYVVPPPYRPEQGAYQGTLGRAEDELVVVVQDVSGNPLTSEALVAQGAIDDRGQFQALTVDMAPLFESSSLQDYVGQRLRLLFKAPNPSPEQGDSEFHIDQVRCEICTTVQEPGWVTDKVRRLGGNARVIVAGQAIEMQGIDVWATQLQVNGSPPLDQLDFQATYTIQDSTYSFYNLNPGRYRIYAEVWIGGNLYAASTTVDVVAGETNTDVNLTLI
jgi:hypothetical protein